MTIEIRNTVEITDTRAMKKRAANWLQRADGSDWNEKDQADLESWLSESPANRVAYWRVKSAWERAHRLRVLQSVTHERVEAGAERPWRRFPVRTVAALGLFSLLGIGAVFLSSGARQQTFSTAVGGHEIISLADGTQIELNTDTLLRTKFGARERTVTLDKGEAYFKVAHDVRRPFAVIAGEAKITDLGTKFVVRRDPGNIEVALIEGRAEFNALNEVAGRPILLAPGDVIKRYGHAIHLQRKSKEELTDELGWRRGVLIFSHATLADAAAEFNRYNSHKIVIADPAVAQIAIGGTFEADKLGTFAQLARRLLGLHVETRGDEVVISR
jgi:transmembrane sensor